MADVPESGTLRFESFELDLASGELVRAGSGVRLRRQASVLLALLATRSGRLVGRDEIRAALWDTETFISFDQGVNDCVREIRQALGDRAASPRYVQTLPRRGYRFIAPVAWAPAPRIMLEAPGAAGSVRRRLAWAALAVIASAAVAAAYLAG